VAIFVFLSMFGMTGLATSFLSGGMEITIQCVDSVWLFLFSSVCLEWPVSQPLFFQEGWRSQFMLLTSKQDQIGALLGCIFCTMSCKQVCSHNQIHGFQVFGQIPPPSRVLLSSHSSFRFR
jgi:hypothetical protein